MTIPTVMMIHAFGKGITKIIIPSAGGVWLRGLFVMLPTDSTSTTD
ncbi:TPA: hypothetical protein RMT52_005069 [Escherichia coli]|uniref:Uncharacterized protein n=1 Tax=Escherichia coli TaxID=562 RepID=A0A6L6ZUX8_ECOLX|nr:hypothetical protein [Escherichia coli]EGO4139196.1 hypothetical protein [Escherichia coli]EGO4194709.1 hypothetical protein [Escherichia coli]EHJ6103543.1 hypothetical protein [Escherichia coli]EHL5737980.1 hypothetical protein [Escherichia coli]EHL6350999.1 hypothetical protein [Escherichia coli]